MYKLKSWAFIALLSLLLFSCDEDDDADDHDHEHFEPVKWEIESGDETYMIIDNGEFDTTYNSSFVVDQSNPRTFSIEFYDKDDDDIDPDEDEYSFTWRFDGYENGEQSEVASINVIDQGSDDDYYFSISGNNSGTINVQLIVLHGDHADATSPSIPVIVE